MTAYSTIAAVDLGSNSFHLQVARVDGDQLYPLDSLRAPIRLGAGLTKDKRLDEPAQERALECLRHFGERLRGFDPHSVRCVGTNTLRVAKNAAAFLKKAQAALGFPIEVVAGREEARLIYLGVSHSLPASKALRLVMDIGGGSTEFIIGRGLKPLKLESLYMGCVSYSLRYFPGGRVTKSAMKEAEVAARRELQPIIATHARGNWDEAVASSGTARSLAELIELNGFGEGGITPDGLDGLRQALLRAGDLDRLALEGVRTDRLPVLPGGLAIMSAALRELGIERMGVATGAMRQGILYDLLGRFTHHDMRDVTVQQFMQRYHVDPRQARRVAALAVGLYRQFSDGVAAESEAEEQAPQFLDWAAKLHEIGITVAYSGYNRHSAYILRNADMPGFSRAEQERLAGLVLAHRRSLRKILPELEAFEDWREVMALRLAALFHRSRSDVALPDIRAKAKSRSFRVKVDRDWLKKNPLTVAALREEIEEWAAVGIALEVKVLDEIEAPSDLALVG
jgi:exopolyphosphatase/guanosine-5'-triphosphate,3'-diphosphate pyrophosphatase